MGRFFVTMKLLKKAGRNDDQENDQVVGSDQLYEGTYWLAGTCLLVNRDGLVLVAGLFRLVAVAKGAVGRPGNLSLMGPGHSAELLVGKMERGEQRWH